MISNKDTTQDELSNQCKAASHKNGNPLFSQFVPKRAAFYEALVEQLFTNGA